MLSKAPYPTYHQFETSLKNHELQLLSEVEEEGKDSQLHHNQSFHVQRGRYREEEVETTIKEGEIIIKEEKLFNAQPRQQINLPNKFCQNSTKVAVQHSQIHLSYDKALQCRKRFNHEF